MNEIYNVIHNQLITECLCASLQNHDNIYSTRTLIKHHLWFHLGNDHSRKHVIVLFLFTAGLETVCKTKNKDSEKLIIHHCPNESSMLASPIVPDGTTWGSNSAYFCRTPIRSNKLVRKACSNAFDHVPETSPHQLWDWRKQSAHHDNNFVFGSS